MARDDFTADLARAHELADQAQRLIEILGERLGALHAGFKADHHGPGWEERIGGEEAWVIPWRESGLEALWDRLDDLHDAVDAASHYKLTEAAR